MVKLELDFGKHATFIKELISTGMESIINEMSFKNASSLNE
jgi:hypothetical protein